MLRKVTIGICLGAMLGWTQSALARNDNTDVIVSAVAGAAVGAVVMNALNDRDRDHHHHRDRVVERRVVVHHDAPRYRHHRKHYRNHHREHVARYGRRDHGRYARNDYGHNRH